MDSTVTKVNVNRWNNGEFVLETKLFDKAKEISVVGLKHCLNSNKGNKTRLKWILLVAFGFVVASYLIVERLVYYFTYPIATDMDFVSANTIPYPQITLCNNNFFKKSAVKELGE